MNDKTPALFNFVLGRTLVGNIDYGMTILLTCVLALTQNKKKCLNRILTYVGRLCKSYGGSPIIEFSQILHWSKRLGTNMRCTHA